MEIEEGGRKYFDCNRLDVGEDKYHYNGQLLFSICLPIPTFHTNKSTVEVVIFRDFVKLGGKEFFNMCHGVKFSFVFLF